MQWGLKEGICNDQDEKITNECMFQWKEENQNQYFQGCKEEQQHLTE